jgi:hypothetical protein
VRKGIRESGRREGSGVGGREMYSKERRDLKRTHARTHARTHTHTHTRTLHCIDSMSLAFSALVSETARAGQSGVKTARE